MCVGGRMRECAREIERMKGFVFSWKKATERKEKTQIGDMFE